MSSPRAALRRECAFRSACVWPARYAGPPWAPAPGRRARFLRREPTDQPQRQRHTGLHGQHRMAGDEDEAQQIVADVVVEGGIKVGLGSFALGLQLPAQLVVLALD